MERQDLTMADDLFDQTPAIESALDNALCADAREPKARDYFYASSLGMCVRKQIAERAGLEPTNPTDPRSRRKMWTGTVMGRALSDVLLKEGFLEPEWCEKRLEYRCVIGKVDGYTKRIPSGAIVEIKTSDDDAITRYKDTPEHYLWQGLWYCLAANVPNLLLYQFGKSQGISRHRVIAITDEWKQNINTHIDWLEREWANYERTRVLPEHFHQFQWENKLCAFGEPQKKKGAVA